MYGNKNLKVGKIKYLTNFQKNFHEEEKGKNLTTLQVDKQL